MPSQDALRTSLDRHEVDRKAGRDRQYVESVLRRIQVSDETSKETKKTSKVKEESSTSTNDVKMMVEDAPAFARVKAIEHPRQEEEVQFREVTGKKKKKARKPRDESPVIWEDVAEGEDPARRPDPNAGYMKGPYALMRRQVDDDHAVYFFATEVVDDAEQTRVPPEYEVRLTEGTELPYIARRGKQAHLNQTEQVRAKDMDEAIQVAAKKGLGGIRTE